MRVGDNERVAPVLRGIRLAQFQTKENFVTALVARFCAWTCDAAGQDGKDVVTDSARPARQPQL
jgi:hypothetical protein